MTFTEHYEKTSLYSDKGTTHSYICWFYNGEFTPKMQESPWIVEIGVETGDSLEVLAGWFHNGKVWGIDIEDRGYVFKNKNINFIHADAYTEKATERFEDGTLDYVIDDGPHTLESQIKCVELWMPKLKRGGKLIIEDVQDFELATKEFNKFAYPRVGIDLRKYKDRYDDVIFCLTK